MCRSHARARPCRVRYRRGGAPSHVAAQVVLPISEFTVTTAVSVPYGMAGGPDGNIWFTERNGNKIGRITPGGTITEFTVSTAGAEIEGITAGPDGNLWFVELTGNKIGRITPSGTITEFPLSAVPVAPQHCRRLGREPLVYQYNGNRIGRITPSGTITEFPLSSRSLPWDITAGPDGNLWFTEQLLQHDREDHAEWCHYGVPDRDGKQSVQLALPRARMGISGLSSNWATRSGGSRPVALSRSSPCRPRPAGSPTLPRALTGTSGSPRTRLTRSGGSLRTAAITEFSVPTASGSVTGIAAGPDGNIWFTERNTNKIGRITLPDFAEVAVYPAEHGRVVHPSRAGRQPGSRALGRPGIARVWR